MAEQIIGGRGRYQGIKITIGGATPKEIADGVARLGKLPASSVSGPAKKSATKVKRLARAYAPKATGALKQGIVVSHREKSKAKGKAVFDVWMDAGMNGTFAKYANGKRYYYPSSMEYGFQTTNGGRVAGHYFLRDAAQALNSVHERLVLDDVSKRLDKLWLKQKGGGT